MKYQTCLRQVCFNIIGLLLLSILACQPKLPQPDADNGGLFLPEGFQALVVADSVPGRVRHITVSDQGKLYAKLKFTDKGAVAAVLDHDGDGRSDEITSFGNPETAGKWSLQTGVRIYKNYLYFSTELTIYRMKMKPGTAIPEGDLEVVLQDDHPHGKHEHIAKPFAFDDQGHMYVPFGAPTNACQDPKRTPGAPV